MHLFLAHKKLLSRMFELGLFDEFFTNVEQFTSGDTKTKSYLQKCAQAYEININFPRKDKFAKDIHFSLFFDGINSYVHLHSIHVMYTLLLEEGFDYTDDREEMQNCLDSLSDEQLKQVLENLDFDVLHENSFEQLQFLIEEEDLDDYISNLPEADELDFDSCSEDYPFTFFEDLRHIDFSQKSLEAKYNYLNFTAHDLFRQKNKSKANSASSAHKKRVKKQSAQDKAITNKVDCVNLGYRLSDDMPLSYFQPSQNADFGFNLVKNLDLFGLHLILVAQRRKYHFETTLGDEYRGNYDAIADIDLNELVYLHDSAVKACQEYQTACAAVTNSLHFKSKCLGAYLTRNNALAEYARFYNEIFEDLGIYDHQINDDNYPWFYSKRFFNLNLISEPLFMFCDNCYTKEIFYLFSSSPNKALDYMRNWDNSLLEGFNFTAPMTIYQACSRFASTFDSIESTHPVMVDFKAIAQKVLNYSQELESIGYLKFPYAIELDNYICQPSTYTLALSQTYQLKRDFDFDLDYYKFNTNSETLKLNCQPNDYVFIFSGLSLILDAINDQHIQLFAFKTKTQGIPAIFNWYGDNSKDVDVIYPLYEQWRNHPIVAKLADAHKRCFELLILIMDLKGELRELYQDPYFVTLLKQLDSYDEEFASSLANHNDDDAGDAPKLSKQENVLLNKAIVNYLKTVEEFCQNFFEFTHTSILSINEIFAQAPKNTQAYYNTIVSSLKSVSNIVHYFSNSLIISLDNAPEELKPNFANHKHDYENSAINALFYQSIKESIFIFFGKIMCNFARPYASYWNYQDIESFKKYYSLVCADIRTDTGYDSYFFAIIGLDRMLTLNPNLDEKEVAKVKQSLVCEHSFVKLLIKFMDKLLYQVLCSIGCCLVNYVAKLTTKKSLVEHIDEINVLVSIIHKLKSLAPLQGHATSLYSQAAEKHFFLTENNEFREIVSQYLNTLKLATQAVLHPDYADFKLDSLNHENFLVRSVYLFEQLLSDPATVLTYIVPDALKERAMGSSDGVYSSTAPFYGPVVLNFPNCIYPILEEFTFKKNSVPVFLNLFGKEFTETLHPCVYYKRIKPGTACNQFFPPLKQQIKCKPVVERALNQLIKEVSDTSIASALESIDIYQGVDMSVDNWSYEEYINEVDGCLDKPVDIDDEINDFVETQMAWATNTEEQLQLSEPKLTLISMFKASLLFQQSLLANPDTDDDERERTIRFIKTTVGFLDKAILVACECKANKDTLDKASNKISNVFVTCLKQGMHRTELQALEATMHFFLKFVELGYYDPTFNNDLNILAKLKDNFMRTIFIK